MTDCGGCPPFVFPGDDCGVTDSFNRPDTTPTDWGVSDSGHTWSIAAVADPISLFRGYTPSAQILSNKGQMVTPEVPILSTQGDASQLVQSTLLGLPIPAQISFDVTFIRWLAPTLDLSTVSFAVDVTQNFRLAFNAGHQAGVGTETLGLSAASPTNISDTTAFSVTEGSTYHVFWEIDEGVESRVTVTPGPTVILPLSGHLFDTGDDYFRMSILNSMQGDPFTHPAYLYGMEVLVDELNCFDIDGKPIAICPPDVGQAVLDEPAGVGDGVTTVFTTVYPYLQTSLEVYVGTILVEADTTDPANGSFTLTDPASLGAEVRVSYRAGES